MEKQRASDYGLSYATYRYRMLKGIPLDAPLSPLGAKSGRRAKEKIGRPALCTITRGKGRPERCIGCREYVKCLTFCVDQMWPYGWVIKGEP